MAYYTKGMLLFGLVGVLVVSMWCMKGTEAHSGSSDHDKVNHAVKREDPPEGCVSKHTEGGVEECSGEDDSLGLYADVDDSFRARIKKAASHLHHHHDVDDHVHGIGTEKN